MQIDTEIVQMEVVDMEVVESRMKLRKLLLTEQCAAYGLDKPGK